MPDLPAVEFRPPPDPGEFSRPYVDQGHAREAAPATPDDWSHAVPPSTSTPDPGDYQRGPLTDGHQRTMPAVGAAAPPGPQSGASIDRTKPRGSDDPRA